MLEIKEYEYETGHLTGNEALKKYRREKTRHPDAIVTLEDLACGHWAVLVYKSEQEKEALLQKKMAEMLGRFRSIFKK